MINFLLFALAFLLIGIGFVGCFVQKVPGPIMAFLGILILYFKVGSDVIGTEWLILCAAIVALSMIVGKYLVPKLGKLVSEYGKGGKVGTVLGAVLSVLILAASGLVETDPILSIILFLAIPFVLASLFEIISKKDLAEGIKSGTGAYVTYLANTLLKLAACLISIYAAFGALYE